jgi:hypothetical protein
VFIKPSACWIALKLPRVSGSASGSNAGSLTNVDYFSDNSGPVDPAQAVDGLVMRGVIKWPSIKGDFHIPTGKPMTPPACRPLKAYALEASRYRWRHIYRDPRTVNGVP